MLGIQFQNLHCSTWEGMISVYSNSIGFSEASGWYPVDWILWYLCVLCVVALMNVIVLSHSIHHWPIYWQTQIFLPLFMLANKRFHWRIYILLFVMHSPSTNFPMLKTCYQLKLSNGEFTKYYIESSYSSMKSVFRQMVCTKGLGFTQHDSNSCIPIFMYWMSNPICSQFTNC